MDIQEALETTGKAHYEGSTAYVQWRGWDHSAPKTLWWVDKKTGEWLEALSHEEILETWFRPYVDGKEIRPEDERELWINDNGAVLLSGYSTLSPAIAKLIFRNADGKDVEENMNEVIHGQNGWTRILPKVEDENIERIRIMRIGGDVNKKINLFSDHEKGYERRFIWNDLANHPNVKLIIEQPKGELDES